MKTKPGYKTTEFWLTVAAALSGSVMAAGLPEEHWVVKLAGQATAILSVLGYTVARSLVKRG